MGPSGSAWNLALPDSAVLNWTPPHISGRCMLTPACGDEPTLVNLQSHKTDALQVEETLSTQADCCTVRAGPHSGRLGLDRRVVIQGEDAIASEFFAKALGEQLSPRDVFRITITSFLDAYNFDLRRLMKCCIHHVLPSGHVIPFCAYNVLYRDGHVPLPALTGALTRAGLVSQASS